jgi:hypothetical protein
MAGPDLSALIGNLVRAYPNHVLVFPGIVPHLDPSLAEALSNLGCRPVRSRMVHVVYPGQPLTGRGRKRVRRNRRLDRELRRASERRRITDPRILLRHVPRLHALYSQLYLQRHPGHLNARYEQAFFQLLLESGLFSASAWHRDGVIEAFNIHLVTDGVIRWSVCGVDVAVSVERGLFRLAVDHDLAEAERDGLIVNLGAGNSHFKRLRGAEVFVEYDMVFDRHVSALRRVPWSVLQQIRKLAPQT